MRFHQQRVAATRARRGRKVLGFIGVAAATVLVPSIAMAANSAAPAAHNDFEKNTNGWYGSLEIVKSGADNPYDSGYANEIRASQGSHYASVDVESNDDTYTFWKAGIGCCPTADEAESFPASGYTTGVDIYLDTEWAAENPGARFDWDSAITESKSYLASNVDDGFLSDLVYNGSTTPTGYPGGPGFVIQASQNSQTAGAFAENPCSPLVAQSGGGCVPPAVITESGWYTFTHYLHASDGYVVVDMTITDAHHHTVAAWTANPLHGSKTCGSDPSPCAIRVENAGAPAYGWFDFQEIPGLPIDNAFEHPGHP